MGISLRAQIRKQLRTVLNRSLALLFPAAASGQSLPREQLHRILVVRTNHRIGNLLFLTPLLRALHTLLPGCQIDLVISLPAASVLLQPLPGIGQIFVLPKSAFTSVPVIVRLLRQLSTNHYDLIIEPNGKSASGRLVAALIKSRWKLGFYIAGSWSPLTHWVALPREIQHEASRPLQLLQAISGNEQYPAPATLELALSDEEKQNGVRYLQHSLAHCPGYDKGDFLILGLFRLARRDKRIADSWWLNLVQELRSIAPSICILEIVSPDEPTALLDGGPTIQLSDLRQLAAVMSQLDGFISADTGPMHLASAANTPTIAFFNSTTADIYGPVGNNDLALEQHKLSVPALAELVASHLYKTQSEHSVTGVMQDQGLHQ